MNSNSPGEKRRITWSSPRTIRFLRDVERTSFDLFNGIYDNAPIPRLPDTIKKIFLQPSNKHPFASNRKNTWIFVKTTICRFFASSSDLVFLPSGNLCHWVHIIRVCVCVSQHDALFVDDALCWSHIWQLYIIPSARYDLWMNVFILRREKNPANLCVRPFYPYICSVSGRCPPSAQPRGLIAGRWSKIYFEKGHFRNGLNWPQSAWNFSCGTRGPITFLDNRPITCRKQQNLLDYGEWFTLFPIVCLVLVHISLSWL